MSYSLLAQLVSSAPSICEIQSLGGMPNCFSILTARSRDGLFLPETNSLAWLADTPSDLSWAAVTGDFSAESMNATSRSAKFMSSEIIRSKRKDIAAIASHNSLMANSDLRSKPRLPRTPVEDEAPDVPEPEHFMRAWRLYRKLTQKQLAERVGTSESVISELENRRKAMSLKWLAKLAAALNTKIGFIIEHDPNNLDTDVMEIFANVPDHMKEQAKRTLKAFERDGTNG